MSTRSPFRAFRGPIMSVRENRRGIELSIGFDRFEDDARQTVINWVNTLSRIRDSYEQYLGIPHGIQKDAIQNGWDARVTKRGRGWRFTFRLVKARKNSFLVMQDQGTTGLTGRVLEPDEYTEELPGEERWGRFESLAFTKDPEMATLGSRGQGKFIFVVGSKDHVIVYDTLRADGSYRAGMRRVKRTSSPVNAWDDEEGRRNFAELTENALEPLDVVGTRVVIINPTDELVETIESGEFLEYVSETWWEIILKYGATIEVEYGGEALTASIPTGFQLPDEDTQDYRVWRVENEVIEGDVKVKKLHIVNQRAGNVPDYLRGIAVQRGGMKVDTLEPKYMPREIVHSLYGYVTVDDPAEGELLLAENPEHYGFNYRYRVAKAIRNFVQQQSEAFAQNKLGWQRDRRAIQARRQRNAERRATTQINRIARRYNFRVSTPGPGLGGSEGTGGPGGGGGGGGGVTKDLRVVMPDLGLPRSGDRRVNYGEAIGDVTAQIINNRSDSVDVQLRIYLRRGDELKESYHTADHRVDATSASDIVGPFSQEFDEREFPKPGRYTAVSRIVSLMGEGKGEILDEKRRSFYLEVEPPAEGGIFEGCVAMGFPPKNHMLGRVVTGEEGGYVLQYNVAHPAYDMISNDEDLLAEHLFKIMVLELFRHDFERGEPVIFGEVDVEDSGDVARAMNRMLGEFSFQYYGE